MQPSEKAVLIALVRGSPLPRKQVLAQSGLPKSTYYDWGRRRQSRVEGLRDRPSGSRVPRNKLRPEEEQDVLALARASPELSPRELALQITDADAFSVSESTCYRLASSDTERRSRIDGYARADVRRNQAAPVLTGTSPSCWRYFRTISRAVTPSPAALASCLVLPARTSPAA